MNIKKKLRVIFDETTSKVGSSAHSSSWQARRYIAKSTGMSVDWRVFDRKTQKFLSDQDVKGITDVREPFVS